MFRIFLVPPKNLGKRYIQPGVIQISIFQRTMQILQKGHNLSTTVNRKFVETERQGNVFVIDMNRPEKKNAVNLQMSSELFKAFQEFNNDPLSLTGVLHGQGNSFCAGFDLEELSHLSSGDLPKMMDSVYSHAPMGPSRIQLTKPIIAAVSGYAVAGGLELALLCDLRVMEEDGIMGVFCRRFGVPLIDGGTVRLPRLIGLSRALDLILTGRPVKAEEALNIGLINRIVPKGDSRSEAIKLAEEIAQFPQRCMQADRASAYYSMYESDSIEDALKFELNNGMKVVTSESIPGATQFVGGKGKHGDFSRSKL